MTSLQNEKLVLLLMQIFRACASAGTSCQALLKWIPTQPRQAKGLEEGEHDGLTYWQWSFCMKNMILSSQFNADFPQAV